MPGIIIAFKELYKKKKNIGTRMLMPQEETSCKEPNFWETCVRWTITIVFLF